MSEARSAIFGRLRAVGRSTVPALPDWSPSVPPEERLGRFRERLEANHAEVVTGSAATWPAVLAEHLRARGNTPSAGGDGKTVLYAPGTAHGDVLARAWAGSTEFHLVPYDRPVETLRDRLVHGVDAAVTGTLGGIAETGSLVLWPGVDEPRLMSLLPPLHVALVAADRIWGTLPEAMADGRWADGMPTNALLISGPSKTADIEQTLAYGVHGPKELLVIVLDG